MLEPIPQMTKKEANLQADEGTDVIKKEEIEEGKQEKEEDLIFDEEIPVDPLFQNRNIHSPTAQVLREEPEGVEEDKDVSKSAESMQELEKLEAMKQEEIEKSEKS